GARAGAGRPTRPRERTRRDARGAGVRPVCTRAARVIVRWGLGSLPEACAEAGVSSPLLVASPRWDALALPVQPSAHWREVPSDRIGEAVAAASGADGVLAVGGGSAIDLGKAISAATGFPLVSVPTTYGGAALAGSMLALAHAMAQAIGGRYGLPHGTLNGICLPPTLRFNARYAPDAVKRFGEAVGDPGDPAGRVETLTALAGPTRLREL